REALLAFRRHLEGPSAPELERWDVGYYAEEQRQALYDFDSEELRPYFPLARVVEGLFETARRLYGVRVQPNQPLGCWHPDVRAYDMFDEAGAHLASFYTDFFPRESKRDGAWMNCLISGVDQPGASPVHLGLICANVTPAAPGLPSLLTHGEVETL